MAEPLDKDALIGEVAQEDSNMPSVPDGTIPPEHIPACEASDGYKRKKEFNIWLNRCKIAVIICVSLLVIGFTIIFIKFAFSILDDEGKMEYFLANSLWFIMGILVDLGSKNIFVKK